MQTLEHPLDDSRRAAGRLIFGRTGAAASSRLIKLSSPGPPAPSGPTKPSEKGRDSDLSVLGCFDPTSHLLMTCRSTSHTRKSTFMCRIRSSRVLSPGIITVAIAFSPSWSKTASGLPSTTGAGAPLLFKAWITVARFMPSSCAMDLLDRLGSWSLSRLACSDFDW